MTRLKALLLAGCALLFAACGGGGDSPVPPVATPPLVPQGDRFSVEPTRDVTIARGQSIGIYAALQKPTDTYPQYQSASQISWSSSHPTIASIDSEGVLTGLAEGVTKVSANQGDKTSAIEVRVDGTMESRTLLVAGTLRRYSLYTPSALGISARAPLIVSGHGGGGTAMIQAATTQMNTLAHRERIRIAYLEGTGAIQTFNAGACCGFAQAQHVDDVSYVRAVLDDVQSRVSVDATKIFATGFSNGGMLSYRLACAAADRFAGILAIGGASGQFDFDRNRYYDCNPARPVPIVHVHATNDRNYPFAGGFGDGISDTNYYPVEATITDWIARNNVTASATSEQVTPTTTCRHYREAADNSRPSAPVTLCVVDPKDLYDPATQIVFGGGHSWPGGVRSPARESDTPPNDFHASAYAWSLFNR